MILHMDMDAFFASVEQRDNPELKGKPVIVGGLSGRGVVSSASYEARKSGVRSAMPIFEARRLCPQAFFINPDKGKYGKTSQRIMNILSGFSPVVEKVSVDEAFLDISGLERLLGSPLEIARGIKKEIWEKEGLTCSVGIAPVRFLAKIASDRNKPDGIFIITPQEIWEFMDNLPLSRVPGVGGKTIETISMLGFSYLGQIRDADRRIIIKKLGLSGERLIRLANGMDEPVSDSREKNHSISKEITMQTDISDREVLKKALMQEADEVCRELREKRLKGRTVSIKIKTADFRQNTRSKTLKAATNCSRSTYIEACSLLKDYEITMPIRLIGLSVSNLVSESSPSQGLLFGNSRDKDSKWSNIDKALDRINARYGNAAVSSAFVTEKDE